MSERSGLVMIVIPTYDVATGAPLVRLQMQEARDPERRQEWHLTPSEARDVAISLLQGARAAEEQAASRP